MLQAIPIPITDYKNGYFHQKINGYGDQETEYNDIDLFDLPINPVKDEKGEDLIIYVKLI